MTDDSTAPGAVPEVRASDAEREQVVELMRQASTEGRLSLEELIERSDAAYSAKTRGELERLTADLPAAHRRAQPVQPAREPTRAPATRRVTRWAVACMCGVDRRGRWRPAEQVNVVAVMGGGVIDLREAVITDPEITINAVAVMGGIDVIVPEGVEVDFTGFAFMGGRDEKVANVPVRPGTPLIRVRGFTLMGGVTVRSRPSRSHDDDGGSYDEEPDWYSRDRRDRRREHRRDRRHGLH